MAKKSSDNPQTSEGAEGTTTPEPIGTTVKILMRNDSPHGAETLKAGQEIGTVQLAAGVSLNYFVDAVRMGLASEEQVVKELRGETPEE